MLSFIYGTKLSNYIKRDFQDILNNIIYASLGTYIFCWMFIFSFQH